MNRMMLAFLLLMQGNFALALIAAITRESDRAAIAFNLICMAASGLMAVVYYEKKRDK